MSVPKRHHYVPQMILNGFTDPDGWLHWCRCLERPNPIRRARPAELFHQKHLYSTVSASGIKDPTMEGMLSVLESEAVKVVEAIISQTRGGHCPELTEDQKQVWYMFFLMQWRRTPENQRANTSDAEASRMIDDILSQLRAKLPERTDEIEALATDEAKARTIRNVRVQTLIGFRAEVMNVLERRGISVLRIIKPDKSFIVGSRPVVRLTPRGHTDLNDPAVEMWLPIASDIAVGVGVGDGGVSLHHLSDDRPIRQLNTAIASQSGTVAACSPALIKSIVNRR